jgi:hypothetical protein
MTLPALSVKPRWDKYDGYVGNFRGTLAADLNLTTQANKVLGVGINSSGAVVIGSGQTGIVGVMIVPVGIDIHGNLLDGGINNLAGDPCDVGKHGEITNFAPSTGTAAAGTKYYAHADGSIDATATAGVLIGHTVEADRLIVNLAT